VYRAVYCLECQRPKSKGTADQAKEKKEKKKRKGGREGERENVI
jgi:hypothetical protein